MKTIFYNRKPYKSLNLYFIKILIAVAAVLFSGGNIAEAKTFRVATLSPGGSFWMESFKAAADEIKLRTEGRITFRFYPGGVMGSEQVVLRKMRIGQLQGAAVSTGAFDAIYPDLSLYGVPFMFASQDHVDYVRARLDGTIKAGATEKGYTVTGIVGGGFAYIMSQHPSPRFEDLKNRKIWVPESDQRSAENLRELGLNPIPLSLGDVLMGLETGLIDTIAAPPVVAIALQWHTRISHVVRIPLMPIHGTVVLDNKAFHKLNKADQVIVLEVFGRTAEKIQAKNNQDNKNALNALKSQGIEVFEPQGADAQTWKAIEATARKQAIENSAIDPSLLGLLQKYADEYTQKQLVAK